MVQTRVAFILTETTADCKHKNICSLYVMCYELLSSMSHSELGKLTSSAPSARHAKMQTPWTFDQCRQYQQTGRREKRRWFERYAPTAMGQWGGSQNCTLQPWKLHMVSSFCIIPRQELQDSESVGLWECIAEHTVVRASTALWGLSTSSLNVHHISFRIYVVIDTTEINCKYGFRIVLLCFCFPFLHVFFCGISHISLTVSFCLWRVL